MKRKIGRIPNYKHAVKMKSLGKRVQRTLCKSNISINNKDCKKKGMNRTAGGVRSANHTLRTIILHETHILTCRTGRCYVNTSKTQMQSVLSLQRAEKIKMAGNSVGLLHSWLVFKTKKRGKLHWHCNHTSPGWRIDGKRTLAVEMQR